jgi:hypothetical protein
MSTTYDAKKPKGLDKSLFESLISLWKKILSSVIYPLWKKKVIYPQ